MNNILEKKLEGVIRTLEDRLDENRAFFKNIDIKFINRSRNLSKEAKIYLNEKDELVFEIKKEKSIIAISQLYSVILSSSKEFDDVTIKYVERGTEIMIWTEKNNVKIKYNEIQSGITNTHDDVSVRTNRDYVIKAAEASDVLREIGVLTSEGKVKNDMIRKYNQIDHFIELIDGLLKELADKDSITVLDCACGKSYLSFVLNYYIKEKLKKNCNFIGLDISEQVIAASKKMAANLGYKNMEFLQMNIQNYMPERAIDLVISLHGCDIATDMAIAAGIRYEAAAIVVIPCCQKELLSQYSYNPFKEIMKHGILKARLADVITDGVRGIILEAMGYDVSVVEYISPLDTPKNLMIRAVKQGGKNRKAYDEYLQLKEALGIEPTLARLINI